MVTVYVESNFILRLALRQDQSSECERLMQAAESNSLMLAMPVLALFESLYRLRGKSQERAGQGRQLLQMFRELRRTDIQPHLQAANHLYEAGLQLELLDDLERDRLASAIV
jgi:predicted nucleic acid-binding protein